MYYLYDKEDFIDVIKLWVLRWMIILDCLDALNVIKGSL